MQREVDPEDSDLQIYYDKFIISHHVCDEENIADDNNTAWQNCLEVHGLDSETIETIIDLYFREIRLAESALFWAKNTIKIQYQDLQEIQDTSHERAITLQLRVTRPASGEQDTQKSTAGRDRQFISGAQQQVNPGITRNSWNSASALAARNTPSTLVLYKALAQARIYNLYDHSENLDTTGSLLSSALPVLDFSSEQYLYDFTPDFRVVE